MRIKKKSKRTIARDRNVQGKAVHRLRPPDTTFKYTQHIITPKIENIYFN